MRVWILKPINDKGSVTIRAESEGRAREIAHNAFSAPPMDEEDDQQFQPMAWASIAWIDHNAVSCTYESDDLSKEEGILNINK